MLAADGDRRRVGAGVQRATLRVRQAIDAVIGVQFVEGLTNRRDVLLPRDVAGAVVAVFVLVDNRPRVIGPFLIDHAAEAVESSDIAGGIEIRQLRGGVVFLDDLARAQVFVTGQRSAVVADGREPRHDIVNLRRVIVVDLAAVGINNGRKPRRIAYREVGPSRRTAAIVLVLYAGRGFHVNLAVVGLIFLDQVAPGVVDVFDLVARSGRAARAETGDASHAADVVVAGVDDGDGFIDGARGAPVGDPVVGKPAGGVVGIRMHHAALVGAGYGAAETVVGGRSAVGVGRCVVGINNAGLQGGVDGRRVGKRPVEVRRRLRRDALARALGVVGGHGYEAAGGIVLVIDRHVMVCVGFLDGAIGVEAAASSPVSQAVEVLDGADGPPGGVVDGLVDAAEVVDRAIGVTGGVVDVERELEVDAGLRALRRRGVRHGRSGFGNVGNAVGIGVDQCSAGVEEVVRRVGRRLVPVVGRGQHGQSHLLPILT